MKILILSDGFPPQNFDSGHGLAFNLAQFFLKAGHQVFVINAVRDKAQAQEIEYQGLKIFSILSNYHERWRAYLGLYNPQTVGKVREIIKKIKPDVVQFHNIHYYLSYHCFKIAKQYSKAVFLSIHDTMSFNYGKLATNRYLEPENLAVRSQFDYRSHWWDHIKQAQKRYNPVRNLLIKRYLRSVDKVFPVSNALKEALIANRIKNRRDMEVIHNGIDVNSWQINPESVEKFKKKYNLLGKQIILFSGRASSLKGINQISQAVEKIKKKHPQAVLMIPGQGGIDWLQGEELKAAYFSADVVVVPSVCFDSFPTANLEAMAAKKPVVGTCFGGTPEIVQDGVTGYIVNPFNIDLLADRIIDLLENPQKAKQFGEAGYQRVKKHFSLDTQADQILFWYQKVLAKK